MPLQIAGKLPISGATGDVLTITGPVSADGRSNPYIRITSMFLSVSATSTVTFKSGSDEIGGAFLGTGNNYQMQRTNGGILDCEPGKDFVINNSAGTIRGHLTYEVVGGG